MKKQTPMRIATARRVRRCRSTPSSLHVWLFVYKLLCEQRQLTDRSTPCRRRLARGQSKVATAPVEQTVETTTIVSVNLWGQITVLAEADTGRDAIVIVTVGPLERRLFVLTENDLIADDRPEGVIAEDYYALTC